MQTFIAAFVILLLVVGGMAIGYVFKRRALTGSCGGIGALGMEKVCDCEEPCDRRKAEMAKHAAHKHPMD